MGWIMEGTRTIKVKFEYRRWPKKGEGRTTFLPPINADKGFSRGAQRSFSQFLIGVYPHLSAVEQGLNVA